MFLYLISIVIIIVIIIIFMMTRMMMTIIIITVTIIIITIIIMIISSFSWGWGVGWGVDEWKKEQRVNKHSIKQTNFESKDRNFTFPMTARCDSEKKRRKSMKNGVTRFPSPFL